MNYLDDYEKRVLRKKIIIIVSVAAVILVAAVFWFTQFWNTLEVQKITIEPAEAIAGNPVIISAPVENRGSAPGEYLAELKIEGSVVEKKTLNIPAKGRKTAVFSYTPENVGEYNVAIGQASAAFNAREGLLPSWCGGDTWTYGVNIGPEQYDVTYEVLGEANYEGSAIYVLSTTSKSQSELYNRGTIFVDKNTLSVTGEERVGKIDNTIIYQKTVVASNIDQGARWPLAAGNAWTERTSKNITTKTGFALSEQEVATAHTFDVEGTEDITTPVGVYRCFKIVERDEAENIVGTAWYSDKIKKEAKYETVLDGSTYSFGLVSCKVSACTAKTLPKVDIEKLSVYVDPGSAFNIYYQAGWQVETREEGTVHIFTSAEANGLKYGSIRISSVTVPDPARLDLDVVYNDILADTRKNDPAFVLVDSFKIPAGFPSYQLQWRSRLNNVDTKGKTFMIVKGQKLYVVTGWVQEKYEKTYGPQLEQCMGSFGINN